MRKISLCIMLVLILAACASPAPTATPTLTQIATGTATAVPLTSTPTETLPPTPTFTITPAPTPEPTLTPTQEPVTPLPNLITNLTATQKELFLKDLAEQLPIFKENGSYHMFCVGDEIVTHEPAIQLPTGQEISHTFYCQYFDAEGNQQGFHIPVFVYDLKKILTDNDFLSKKNWLSA